jgi:hypothetical protein
MYKVLVVNKRPEDCSAALRVELPSCEFEGIREPTAALKRILHNNFTMAVISLDMTGPCVDGLDLAKECILAGKPVILITPSYTKWLAKLRFATRVRQLHSNILFVDTAVEPDVLASNIEGMLHKKVDITTISKKLLNL